MLNAPVEVRCRRSNSSCSFGGRRGGAGPVAKAGLMIEVEKWRGENGRRKRGGKMRGMIDVEKRCGYICSGSVETLFQCCSM